MCPRYAWTLSGKLSKKDHWLTFKNGTSQVSRKNSLFLLGQCLQFLHVLIITNFYINAIYTIKNTVVLNLSIKELTKIASVLRSDG